MKRLWLGIGILLALAICGGWVSHSANATHGDMAARLEQAQQAALAEDWAAVAVLTEQIRTRWQRSRLLSAAVGDHTILDQIEAGLARLAVYEHRGAAMAYAAQSAALARQVEALGEAHRLTWENFL